MLTAALEKSSRGWTDATTSATAVRSKFEIRGVSGTARHTHGGAPAQLGHARFVFANHDEKPHRVSVVDIEFLQGIKGCEQPPAKVVSHPKSGGILLADGTQGESAPPGRGEGWRDRRGNRGLHLRAGLLRLLRSIRLSCARAHPSISDSSLRF
jgi:hypothetical protein